MHVPVLKNEIIEYLDPKPGEVFIDCTINGGGHAKEILQRIQPNGKLLGFEADPDIYRKIEASSKMTVVNENFRKIGEVSQKNGFEKVDGILFDLGISSNQLDASARGFSFLKDEPLDMRFNPETQKISAKDILNNLGEKEIEAVIRRFGEERYSSRIAKEIVARRRIKQFENTKDLVDLIEKTIPRTGKIHPATRTFQALRIRVNEELEALEEALPQALCLLKPQARMAVISFHSLEDKIVKDFFKRMFNAELVAIITKKPVVPSFEEIRNNPRSRSAKLRVAQRKQ